jgi:hypothetical protein
LINKTIHRPKFAAHNDQSSLDTKLLAISELSVDELREAWKANFTDVAPSIRSRAILCQLFAWRVQTDAIGGLDSATARSLTKIGETLQRDGSYEPKIRCGFSTGMVFSREWKGIVHKVTVVADGLQYLGKRYRSLSDIARTITGTRWSGPRFFGLEQKKAPASARTAQ